jgi:hypothetical protein
MRLGTAVWQEGPVTRTTLVAPLPSDPARVVDLNRVEHLRLAKLGEGRPEALAAELVPASLRRVLEGGPRALHRVRQALAYAEKWQGRRGLPEELGPRIGQVALLPCLPRPSEVRRWDGTALDRQPMRGPGALLGQSPVPTLAWIGLGGGTVAGCCLALDDSQGVVLGGWLELDLDWQGSLALITGGRTRRVPLDTWRDLAPREPRPAGVVLAPPPRIRIAPGTPGGAIRLVSPFEILDLRLGESLVHPILQ